MYVPDRSHFLLSAQRKATFSLVIYIRNFFSFQTTEFTNKKILINKSFS